MSGTTTRLNWSVWHDERIRKAWTGEDSPQFRQLLAQVMAERGQAQVPGTSRPVCLVCHGSGFRPGVPGWARENCEPCPKCQGSLGDSEHCRECQGSGYAGGQRVVAPPVECAACKGTGQPHGRGGEVLWDLGGGQVLADSSGQRPMGLATQQEADEPLFLRARRAAPPIPAASAWQ